MRIGVSLTIPGLDAAGCVTGARQAAEAGADLVAFGEARYDPLTLAARAASLTDAALLAGIARWDRAPAAMARSAITVAELSGRPYRLGVGPGPVRRRLPNGVAQLRDYLTGIRAALDGTDAVRLILAAAGPGTARLAGQSADGVLMSRVHSPSRLRDVLLPAVAAREAGERRIERMVLVRCAVTDTEALGVSVIQQAVSDYELPLLHRMLAADGHDLTEALRLRAAGDREAAAARVPEALVRGLALVGPPDACREQLAAYTDADAVVLFPCGETAHAAVDGALRLVRHLRSAC